MARRGPATLPAAVLSLLAASAGARAVGEAGPSRPGGLLAAGHGRRTLRVLSDLHIGGCMFADPAVQRQLLELLGDMAAGQHAVDELVLLGDVFDVHMVPLGERSASPAELFANHSALGFDVPAFRALVQELAARLPVTVVRGNHDEELDEAEFREAFGDDVRVAPEGLELHGMWLEHGHRVDILNHNLQDARGPRLSMGYYLSRAAATWNSQYYLGDPPAPAERALRAAARELFTRLYGTTPRALDRAVVSRLQDLGAAREYLLQLLSGVSGQEFKTLEDARAVAVVGADGRAIRWGDASANYTLADAIADHEDEWARVAGDRGADEASDMTHALIGDYTRWASRQTGHPLVMTGHTHLPMLKRVPRTGGGGSVLYVNSGAWTRDGYGLQHTTFVDVALRPDPARAGGWLPERVDIFEYPGERPTHSLPVAE